MSIADKLRAALDHEKVPADQWVSKSEQRVRDSIPSAVTLAARAIGYNWGRKDESARLKDIHERVIEMAKAMETIAEVGKTIAPKQIARTTLAALDQTLTKGTK